MQLWVYTNPWAAVVGGAAYVILGLLAGVVTAFAALAPPMVIAPPAGLALMGVLASASQAAFEGPPNREPAVVTLLITASGITAMQISAPV